MRPTPLGTPLALALGVTLLSAQPGSAVQDGTFGRDDGRGEASRLDLLADLDDAIAVVKNKLMGLAEAIPEADYDWRPGEGVRSVREALLHVAADNYFIPIALGGEPPKRTGITTDYGSARTFEERDLSKEQVLEELESSFLHLRRVLAAGDPAAVGQDVMLFGRATTLQRAWLLTTTHLHEHLGQMIAYARSNGVAPPWSP